MTLSCRMHRLEGGVRFTARYKLNKIPSEKFQVGNVMVKGRDHVSTGT